MKRAKQLQEGKGGIDLLEEAAHVFRETPPRTLAIYYAGTIPFLLGVLYFLMDMSQSPLAAQHLAEWSLTVSGLFFWMKLCQASFAARVRAQLALKEAPRWGLNGTLKVLVPQMVIHATGLFILPLAVVLMAPFAWVYAFYQNVTVLADPDSGEAWKLVKKAWKQGSFWVLENHTALGVGLLFGLVVLLNLTLVAAMMPSLLKMLLGIETVFSRSPTAMLNTTFAGIVVGLTYLCVDPILKIVYVLRCFYGESLQSGEDLKADLRQFVSATPRRIAGMLVLSIALAFVPSLLAAQETPAVRTGAGTEVSPAQLDRQIDQVVRQAKYAWRLPRKAGDDDAQKGIITRFFERILHMARDAVSTIAQWIDDLLRKIFATDSGLKLPGFGWISSSGLLFVLLTVLICLLAIFLVRSRRRAAAARQTEATVAIKTIPDLADEDVQADQLPEDEWTSLGRQLLETGEYRLAMRAYYLASLAHLAQQNLVGIAQFKSNRDYETELQRRGHAIPGLAPLFGENRVMLERIWYGRHPADRELVQRFATNVDRIKAVA